MQSVEGDSGNFCEIVNLSEKNQSDLDAGEISYKLPPLIPHENVIREVDLNIGPWKINRLKLHTSY